MKRLLAAAGLALALAACNGGPILDLDRDYQMQVDIACRSLGASLAALAPHRASMSDAVEATVQQARTRAEPLCNAPNPPRRADVARELNNLAFELLTAERSF